jgi:serine/threonine protein kinase
MKSHTLSWIIARRQLRTPSSIESFGRNKKHIAEHILYGLHDLHRNGKIHRDLKPENVLFDNLANPRLTDFGISGHINIQLTVVNMTISRNRCLEAMHIWRLSSFLQRSAKTHCSRR